MMFLKWLDEEKRRRGLSQNQIESMAGLKKGTLSAIRGYHTGRTTKRRNITADHVIKIARALRLEFLQVLVISGHISPEEVSLAKKFIPDDPSTYRIWEALMNISNEEMMIVEKPVLAIVEACTKSRGGELSDKDSATEAGHG